MEKFNPFEKKLFSGGQDSKIKDAKFEKPEKKAGSKYDEKLSEEEIKDFRKNIEENIEKKSEKLGISKEKLIELAELDLKSLDEENLGSINLNRGGLEFISDSINESINEFGKNKETGELATNVPSKVDKFLEFTKKHKKLVGLGELALYLSAFGLPALKQLAGEHATVDIYGEKISLADLAKNPDLINEIEQSKSISSPIEVGREYFSDPFIYEGKMMEFKIASEYNKSKNTEESKIFLNFQSLSYGDAKESQEIFKKLQENLKSLGFDEFRKINLDAFEENREKIAEVISSDINAPKETVLNYIDSVLKINTSKISVIEFEKWEINQDLKFESKIVGKYKEILDRYNTSVPEEKNKAIDEFEEWGKENSYKNVWASLEDEQLISHFSLREAVGGSETIVNPVDIREAVSQEQLMEEKKGFEELLIQMLNKEGYTIDELKEIAKDNPKEIITILSQVIGKNVKYDWEKYKLMEEGKYDELERQVPYHTLKTEKGVCEDYSELLARAKSFLESKGVPNLDKFVVLTTQSDDLNHAWNNLITKNEKLLITSIDITWADDDTQENISKIPERLNAVDEKHHYTGIIKKVDEAHQKALEKIREFNELVRQEKLREILTTYEPQLHKKEQKLEGNKKLREIEKDIEPLREEKKENVKSSIKALRDELKKIYQKSKK